MRKSLLCFATVAVLFCASWASAQQLVYSFEGDAPPDGFGPNGGGVTVTQDTIGVTEGLNSLKASVVDGATFVGALTGNVAAPINDPPGVARVLFDMTITEPFTGGFAVVGVTIFGASQPDYLPAQLFGLQAQFADFEHIGGKEAGTYSVEIDLASATHPITFATGQSFNEIFGTVGSGPNDVIPTGFQLFLNKSNDAPLTVYFDNVRIVVPEPATGSLFGLGVAAIGMVARRRRAA